LLVVVEQDRVILLTTLDMNLVVVVLAHLFVKVFQVLKQYQHHPDLTL
jgi:hypothetical protein